MMGVYIKGLEMPKEGNWKTIRIYPDGTCAVPNWQGDCTLLKGATAVPVPPHGDLIERDAMIKKADGRAERCGDMVNVLDKVISLYDIKTVPIIIQAEEGE